MLTASLMIKIKPLGQKSRAGGAFCLHVAETPFGETERDTEETQRRGEAILTFTREEADISVRFSLFFVSFILKRQPPPHPAPEKNVTLSAFFPYPPLRHS